MRRVGVKRAYPESSSNEHREVYHNPPRPKRARLNTNARPSSRGLLGRAYDWCRSKMSSLYKLFSGWRSANEDEESDSDESFASCTEDSQESSRRAGRGNGLTLSTSMPPVPHTSVGMATQHTHSLTMPSHGTTSKTNKTISSSCPKLKTTRSKQTSHRHTSRTLHAPISAHHHVMTTPLDHLGHPSTSTPLTQPTTTTFTPRLSTQTTPFSSTPFSASPRNHTTFKPGLVHTVSHSEKGDGVKKSDMSHRSFLPLLREISFNTPAPTISTFTTGENPQEKRVPPKSKSSVDSSKITELQEWLEDLRMTKTDASRDRRAEAELIESRLRVCRAERMEIENGRVTRLRAMLQSPRVQEPAPTKLNFDLSQEQLNKVVMAMRRGSSAECLSSGFNISITRSDLGSLVGLNWLNDNVVNFYFNLIRAAHPKVYVMSSFFYPKLSQSGYTSVRRWTKKVDVFAQELVLFPIHLGMHWCLAAADFRNSTLSYYDSLNGDNHACLTRLRNYLEDESENKKGTRYDLSSWKLEICKGIPLQENGSDCGVFMCMFARHLAKGLPFNFSQAEAPKIRQAMICEILEQKLL